MNSVYQLLQRQKGQSDADLGRLILRVSAAYFSITNVSSEVNFKYPYFLLSHVKQINCKTTRLTCKTTQDTERITAVMNYRIRHVTITILKQFLVTDVKVVMVICKAFFWQGICKKLDMNERIKLVSYKLD